MKNPQKKEKQEKKKERNVCSERAIHQTIEMRRLKIEGS